MRDLYKVQAFVVLSASYTFAAILVHDEVYSNGNRTGIPNMHRNCVSVSDVFLTIRQCRHSKSMSDTTRELLVTF